MEDYLVALEEETLNALVVANKARKKGFDPQDTVEIPITKNLAERVVGIVAVVAPQVRGSGILERIAELEELYGLQDWRVALVIALEVAQERFCKFKSKLEAMEVGIRVGFSYVTVGVVVSPLEGFVKLQLNKRRDGKEYFCLFYSGPVRSAGGTGASVSVLIADFIRTKMGYDVYDPTEEEIQRTITEVFDYHERVTNLQYAPSERELDFLVRHIPVQINGDPSEKVEVSSYKDLPRIETNVIRNGVALVMAECLAQKAKKISKQLQVWGKAFELDHWNFLRDFLKIQDDVRAKKTIKKDEKISPDFTFIQDLVAGRPVFTYPMAEGGFRLRYGRCRNSGLSSQAIHPATMVALDGFVAVGTQLKVERPGKATSVVSCDSIEGPIVKLKNGSVVWLESEAEARKFVRDIEEILYLGDILICYGDFLNRAHKLIPVGYCEDEWIMETGNLTKEATIDEAIAICKKVGPLHPRYSFRWRSINKSQFDNLVNWLKTGSLSDKKIILPYSYDALSDVEGKDPKRNLELLGVPHIMIGKEHVAIEPPWSKALLFSLGYLSSEVPDKEDVLEIVNILSGAVIKDKSGFTIGARMGRPEKAKMRKMIGSPHVLFPVGKEGGKMRTFQSALVKKSVTAEFAVFYCDSCQKETIYGVCEVCGKPARRETVPFKKLDLDIQHFFDSALNILKLKHYPDIIKGVRGTSNIGHLTEHLVKGILRASHGLCVNKDGTIRYDMTETTLTHFYPYEIGTTAAKLRELGYTKDMFGNEFKDEHQLLEIKPQDVILPACKESSDEKADEIMMRVAHFLDELLVKLYKVESFYNVKKREDIVGHLIVGMSPHTSAGVVGRIIGFSNTQGFFCHPYFHSLMRRDCDGDEACCMLLLDCLLNFSRSYLPGHRGSQQDAPLVLSTRIIPSEVDDMVFDMDIVDRYPLELYEVAMRYGSPSEVSITTVKNNLHTEREYSEFRFTHNTRDISAGITYSSYKRLPTMMEKLAGQMKIAEKIRAVDENDVARLVVERHFIRDIRGNLRKFSMQQFRCVDCNEKYRRPPLSGKCTCGGKLIFTISEGSIIKYLEPSLFLAEKYNLPKYVKHNLELTKLRIESVFGKEKDKQIELAAWFT